MKQEAIGLLRTGEIAPEVIQTAKEIISEANRNADKQIECLNQHSVLYGLSVELASNGVAVLGQHTTTDESVMLHLTPDGTVDIEVYPSTDIVVIVRHPGESIYHEFDGHEIKMSVECIQRALKGKEYLDKCLAWMKQIWSLPHKPGEGGYISSCNTPQNHSMTKTENTVESNVPVGHPGVQVTGSGMKGESNNT